MNHQTNTNTNHAELINAPKFPTHYTLSDRDGSLDIPYQYNGDYETSIVQELAHQMGGVPSQGMLTNFIFSMACHLRHVCNDNPEWIAEILPTYGHDPEKWMNSIRQACNRCQDTKMPRIMRITLASCKQQILEEMEMEQCNMPPAMPKKLPPLVKLLVSRTPDVYKPAVAHAVFPALASYLWQTRFTYIDNVEHEATLMNVLMAGTGAGKNCITEPINHILQPMRQRDRENMAREREWKQMLQTKGANKDKPKRPEGLVIQEIDPDMTNAAFVQRMADAEGRFLYTKMNEIDQFDALKTSSHSKSQFQIMCLAFDPGNTYGQTRVGCGSVSERVCIRFNWNASTTISKGRKYFSQVLLDGPVSRINFCTIPEREIGADMPVFGTYGEDFDQELRPYLERLQQARGLINCPQAQKLAKHLIEECADFARLSQSRSYENLSYRANVIAYLKAMVLYVAGGEKWDKTLEDFIRWSLQYDMWCKMHFFANDIDDAEVRLNRKGQRGPQNMLDLLPEFFTRLDLHHLRQRLGIETGTVSKMLSNWKQRGYIVPDLATTPTSLDDEVYRKTEKYLKR